MISPSLEPLLEVQKHAKYLHKLNTDDEALFDAVNQLDKKSIQKLLRPLVSKANMDSPLEVFRLRTLESLVQGVDLELKLLEEIKVLVRNEIGSKGNPFDAYSNLKLLLPFIEDFQKSPYSENISDVLNVLLLNHKLEHKVGVRVYSYDDWRSSDGGSIDGVISIPDNKLLFCFELMIGAKSVEAVYSFKRGGKRKASLTLSTPEGIISFEELKSFFDKHAYLLTSEAPGEIEYESIGTKGKSIHKIELSRHDFKREQVQVFIAKRQLLFAKDALRRKEEDLTLFLQDKDLFYLTWGNQPILFGELDFCIENQDGEYVIPFKLIKEAFNVDDLDNRDTLPWLTNAEFQIDKIPNDELDRANELLFQPRFGIQLDVTKDFENPAEENNSFQIRGANKTKFENDSVHTDDFLDTEQDSQVFASILAQRDVKAPVAMALFGNWGSGKSFFMQQLQTTIDALSKKDDKLYHQGIVHVRFNAWSYVDSSLWAGIIVKIFEDLKEYITGQDLADEYKLQVEQDIVRQLRLNRSNVKHLNDDIDKSQSKLNDLIEKKDLLDEELKVKLNELKGLSVTNVVQGFSELLDLSFHVERLKENNDYEAAGKLKSMVGKLGNDIPKILEKLKSKDELRNRFFSPFYLILIAVVLIVILFLLEGMYLQVNRETRDGFSFGFKFILSSSTAVSGFYWRFNAIKSKINKVVSQLTSFQDEYDEKVAKVLAENEEKKQEVQLEIDRLNTELDELNDSIKEKEDQHKELEKQRDYALSTEALNRLILDRAEGSQYKRHLGIVSDIREDFEVLSKILPGHSIEVKDNKDALKNYKPIERIVLYIDDLDRCSDEKVIEVLEAVHLLLAYPLFMVVVGVDKRCVQNALIKRNVLSYIPANSNLTIDQLEQTFGIKVTDPSEYLEKIFQIPYQLPIPSENQFESLVGGILKDSVETFEEAETNRMVSELGGVDSEDDIPQDVDLTLNVPFNMDKVQEKKALRLQDLKLTYGELKQLNAFIPLIGNTPRRIKSFINMYRVIRAHEHQGLNSENLEKSYWAMMFLLSLSIGKYASKADSLFNKIQSASTGTVKEILSKNLKVSIEANTELKPLLELEVADLQSFVPFIRRFSFQ